MDFLFFFLNHITYVSCRGYLVAFKLSPNLRKPHKDAKGADENKKKEIELCKIERIIAISRG